MVEPMAARLSRSGPLAEHESAAAFSRPIAVGREGFTAGGARHVDFRHDGAPGDRSLRGRYWLSEEDLPMRNGRQYRSAWPAGQLPGGGFSFGATAEASLPRPELYRREVHGPEHAPRARRRALPEAIFSQARDRTVGHESPRPVEGWRRACTWRMPATVIRSPARRPGGSGAENIRARTPAWPQGMIPGFRPAAAGDPSACAAAGRGSHRADHGPGRSSPRRGLAGGQLVARGRPKHWPRVLPPSGSARPRAITGAARPGRALQDARRMAPRRSCAEEVLVFQPARRHPDSPARLAG